MRRFADDEVDNPTLRAFAETNVGLYFLQGQGVAQSNSQAIQYLKRAADSGNKRVVNLLERMVNGGDDRSGVIDNVLYGE